MQLKDKIALVTGGTSGIGRAVAELFAEEGAAVTLTGRRRELGQEVVTGIKAKSGQADFVEMDVRQLPEVRAVIDETARRLGRLDILVNNAGISLPRTLLATSEEDYTDLFETNVRSMFFATKWAAELMVRQGLEGREHRIGLGHSRPGRACGLLWNEGRCAPNYPCRCTRASPSACESTPCRPELSIHHFCGTLASRMRQSGRTGRRWAPACPLAALACQKTLPALSLYLASTRRVGHWHQSRHRRRRTL